MEILYWVMFGEMLVLILPPIPIPGVAKVPCGQTICLKHNFNTFPYFYERSENILNESLKKKIIFWVMDRTKILVPHPNPHRQYGNSSLPKPDYIPKTKTSNNPQVHGND